MGSTHQAKYLFKIDLQQAFLQVPLADEETKDITSFIVPGKGLFRFTVMPFGLSGSPITFQRLIDSSFGPELLPFVVCFLDDILICTPDFETHCRYNLRRREVQYKRTFYPSSSVSGRSSKLYPKFEGPFEIMTISPSGVCALKDSSGRNRGLWHASKLKPYRNS